MTDFESLERLGRADLDGRSSEALERLIRHAFETVPYYRDLLSSQGVTSAASLHADDLERLPALSREAVRSGMETGTLLARSMARRRRVQTSTTGSTGIPLRFYGDSQSRRPRSAAWKLLDRWAGIQPGDRRVTMQVPRPRPSWSPARPIGSLRKMVFFHQPSDLISIYKLTAEDIPGIVDALEEKPRPYSIYGTSSAIHFIAEGALAAGLTLDNSPRVVIGTNDTFAPTQRRTASEFFGCAAVSRYGAYEVGGGVAQTCPDHPGVHHVVSELVIVEVVDDDLRPVAPGETGRVLLTDLTNYVMPLIRYDIGDVATAVSGCPCGRPWPAIGEVAGRTADRIVLEDGETRPAYELEAALFYYNPRLTRDILEYQFLQHGPGRIEMRFVPGERQDGKTVERVRLMLEDALSGKARVDVVPVERIERNENGKRRLVARPAPGVSVGESLRDTTIEPQA